MVNVTDGPDVHVRLVALEFLLRHVSLTSHLGDRNAVNSSDDPDQVGANCARR
jgi:hypothetical protein